MRRGHYADVRARGEIADAAVIVLLARLEPEAFHAHTRITNPMPPTIGYGVLLEMTVTSFDRPAAWLGRRGWKVLHTVGSIYLWGTFLVAFLGRALRMPGYWLAVAVAIAAMGVRVVAWWRGRGPGRRLRDRGSRSSSGLGRALSRAAPGPRPGMLGVSVVCG